MFFFRLSGMHSICCKDVVTDRHPHYLHKRVVNSSRHIRRFLTTGVLSNRSTRSYPSTLGIQRPRATSSRSCRSVPTPGPTGTASFLTLKTQGMKLDLSPRPLNGCGPSLATPTLSGQEDERGIIVDRSAGVRVVFIHHSTPAYYR